jgi:hypothetical protein
MRWRQLGLVSVINNLPDRSWEDTFIGGRTSCIRRLRNRISCVPWLTNCISCVSRLRNCIRCVPRLRNCISCVPRLTNCISCVPRLTKCISCVPRCLLHAYYLHPESSNARLWVASPGGTGKQSVQQFECSHTVLWHVTLHPVICTHTELLNDIDSAQLLYHGTV